MMRKWMIVLMLLVITSGCPRTARQQEPAEYQAHKQVEPQPYKEPSKLPAVLQSKPRSP